MLTQSSLNAAYPLASVLASKGWALRPCNETPLQQLVSASLAQAQTLDGVDGSQLEAQPDFGGLLLSSSVAAGPDGKVTHDVIMESAVKAVGAVVAKNLYHARNVVNPQSERIAKDVQAYINANASSSLAPYSVVPFAYKAIWNSPILRELVGKYAQLIANDVPLQPLGITAGAALEETLRTGVARFDDEIAGFLSAGAQSRLAAVWDGLFGRNAGRSLAEIIRVAADRTSCDDALIGFLFCRRIQEEIPEGVNMDINAWRLYISTLQAQLGRQVLAALDRRELDQRNGNLVISFPSVGAQEGEIVVIGDVYSRWLADGGSPEVLFGCLLGSRRFGYRDLLDNAQENLRVWGIEFKLRQAKIAGDKFGYLVSGMQQAMTALIAEIPDDQLPCDRATLHVRLKERLAHLRPKHLEDIFACSRKTVCRTLWLATDAEDMLNCIDQAAKAHPELDIREAALMGTIAFVSRWVSKLFTVDSSTFQGK